MNISKQVHYLFIGTIITLSYILGAAFQTSQSSVMMVSLIPGIVLGLLYTSKRDVLFPVLSGIVVGGVFSHAFIFQNFDVNAFLVIVLEMFAISAVYLVYYVFQRYFSWSLQKLHMTIDIAKFFVLLSVVVVVYSLIMGFDLWIFSLDESYIERYFLRGFSVALFGGTFASTIINSYYHDPVKIKDYNKIEIIKRVIYSFAFILVTYVVFRQDIVIGTYKEMIIILMMMYFISAYRFAIRMMFVNNITIIIIYYFLYFPNPPYQTSQELFLLALYLIGMTSVTQLTRMYYLERVSTIKQLNVAQKTLEQIIISTNNLFKVQDKLPHYKDKFSREYLRDMFYIACNMYPNFDSATCYIKGTDRVEFLGAVGYDIDHINSLKFKPEVFDWTFFTPEIVFETNNENAFPMEGSLDEFNHTYKVIRESLRFTVYVGEGTYGGMSFDIIDGSDKHFTDSDLLHFTTFQNLMNSYYTIGQSQTKENDMKDHIILSILESLNLFDNYTGYHSQEVAELASELGTALGLKDSDVKRLYWAGLVHDIGKIGITADLLNKQGRLTDSEYDVIKMHPVFAFKILRTSEQLESLSTIVLHHHEWWNGEGYPHQLRAMAIPYLSQILHVADAVCAMGRHRKFKQALTIEDIRQELEQGFGKQFSPKVAKAMMEYIDSGQLQQLWKHSRK